MIFHKGVNSKETLSENIFPVRFFSTDLGIKKVEPVYWDLAPVSTEALVISYSYATSIIGGVCSLIKSK